MGQKQPSMEEMDPNINKDIEKKFEKFKLVYIDKIDQLG